MYALHTMVDVIPETVNYHNSYPAIYVLGFRGIAHLGCNRHSPYVQYIAGGRDHGDK